MRPCARLLLLALPLALVACGGALGGAPATPGPTAEQEAIDRVVREEMAAQEIPGCAVAVLRDGREVRVSGYGLANVELRVPVDERTVFQLGSLGKQFTAAAVMLLVEDGALRLDQPVSTYLPATPPAWRTVTVRQLLTHTAGLPDYETQDFDYTRPYTEEQLVALVFAKPPEYPPGARWSYSNSDYVVLGAVLRAASGKFWGDVVRDRLLGPAGMSSARVISEEDIVPWRAAGYRLVAGKLKNQEWVSPGLNATADGSLYASIRDLVAWDRVLRERRLLRPASWKEIHAPVALAGGATFPYGFGWVVEPIHGRPAHRHDGEWQGFHADLLRYPDDGLTVATLCNLAGADPVRIDDRIVAAIAPQLAPPPRVPIADHEPEVRAKLRALLDAAAKGTLSRADFGYLRAGEAEDLWPLFQKTLGPLGAPTRIELVERISRGDDRIHDYDVTYERGVFIVKLALGPDGRPTALRVRPRRP